MAMANIRKQTRLTKPRILAEGHPSVGTHIVWAPPEGGFVKAVGTEITVTIADHVAHFSEDEALDLLSDLLAKFSDLRRERQQKAREYAARNK
jgi:hypothetical protein